MSNITSDSLSIASSSQTIISQLEDRLAPLAAFCTLSEGRIKNLDAKTVLVPRVVSVPVAQDDAVDLESGGGVFAVDEIVANHISVSAHASSGDLQNGLNPAWWTSGLVNTFSLAVWAKAMAQVSVANFGAPTVVGAEAAFGANEVTMLADALKANGRCLVLASSAFQNLANRLSREGGRWIFPGFENGVFEASSFAGAAAGSYGFVATPQAIAGSVGLPVFPPNFRPQLEVKTLALPQLGVSVAFTQWVNPRYRTTWWSLEAIVGFKVANTGALKLVTTS